MILLQAAILVGFLIQGFFSICVIALTIPCYLWISRRLKSKFKSNKTLIYISSFLLALMSSIIMSLLLIIFIIFLVDLSGFTID